ncbi:MAG: hypothetical protein U5K54_07460 [Cytophagales bacterium]|nr:hypothetical protein [Cytophagales bacterium]
MDSTLNIVLIILLLVVIILQVRAYLKLKQKNKLILVQSREIKRQILRNKKKEINKWASWCMKSNN